MIAIAHHPVPETDWLTPCATSCQRYLPQEELTVCQTPHYETGAWWQAWRDCPKAERFYCLHDSTVLQGTPPFYAPVTVVGYMEIWEGCSSEHIAWVRNAVRPIIGDVDEPFTAVHGSMFFCERAVLDALDDAGWSSILPTNKFESQCMERVWGLAFQSLGLEPVSLGRGEDCYREDAIVRKFSGRRT